LPQTALIGEVAEAVAAEPLTHWEAVLKDVDCCYHAVLDYAEAARDPHAKARGIVTGLVTGGKNGDGGNGAGVLFPAWVDGEPPEPRAPVLEVDVETALARWA
jgi:crotonobetainyl-CoA:carnitine CoA-transferase CaiB-like acyl-CoA transferase